MWRKLWTNILIIASIQKASVSVIYESSENLKEHDSHIAIFLGIGHEKAQITSQTYREIVMMLGGTITYVNTILGFVLPKMALMRQVYVIMLNKILSTWKMPWGADTNLNCDGHMFWRTIYVLDLTWYIGFSKNLTCCYHLWSKPISAKEVLSLLPNSQTGRITASVIGYYGPIFLAKFGRF